MDLKTPLLVDQSLVTMEELPLVFHHFSHGIYQTFWSLNPFILLKLLRTLKELLFMWVISIIFCTRN